MSSIVAAPATSLQHSPKAAPANRESIFPAPSWSQSALTIGLTVACLVIGLMPGVADALQFDRSAFAAGEWWRLITGHFTHWSDEHLAWDLIVFFVLGSICERRNRRRFVNVLVAASIAIALGVWALAPGMKAYRGLSGLDTALFGALATTTLKSAILEGRRGLATLILGLLASLSGKIVFELLTQSAVFVNASAAGFQPVPLAHLLGAAIGALGGFAFPLVPIFPIPLMPSPYPTHFSPLLRYSGERGRG